MIAYSLLKATQMQYTFEDVVAYSLPKSAHEQYIFVQARPQACSTSLRMIVFLPKSAPVQYIYGDGYILFAQIRKRAVHISG